MKTTIRQRDDGAWVAVYSDGGSDILEGVGEDASDEDLEAAVPRLMDADADVIIHRPADSDEAAETDDGAEPLQAVTFHVTPGHARVLERVADSYGLTREGVLALGLAVLRFSNLHYPEPWQGQSESLTDRRKTEDSSGRMWLAHGLHTILDDDGTLQAAVCFDRGVPLHGVFHNSKTAAMETIPFRRGEAHGHGVSMVRTDGGEDDQHGLVRIRYSQGEVRDIDPYDPDDEQQAEAAFMSTFPVVPSAAARRPNDDGEGEA